MMQVDDLQVFLEIFEAAAHEDEIGPHMRASHVLSRSDGLFSSEIWRLSRSLRIGAAAGDFSPKAADAADQIWNDLRETRCAPFTEVHLWKLAIKWALVAGDSPFRSINADIRQQTVGQAFSRLRKQGHSLKLSAYGVEIDSRSQIDIFNAAESLVVLIGGVQVIAQLCDFMHRNNRVHDGMWLLGDQVPGISQAKTASPPVGWLFALGTKHICRRASARKPEVAWRTLINLTSDMAATLDCERYNQFEGMDMHPSQFWRSMLDSLFWREFFTLPQVPTIALTEILEALVASVRDHGEQSCAKHLANFVNEVIYLNKNLRADGIAIIERGKVVKAFPTLMQTAFGAKGSVNKKVQNIFCSGERDHERVLLFENSSNDIAVLPSPIFNSAACELAFTTVWKECPRKASHIVGATMERVLAKACRGKTSNLEAGKKYKGYDNKNLEIDVATRDQDDIVFIETKAKSLTGQSRQSGGFNYISDYTNSYLAIIKQLMVHEKSIRAGISPLAVQDEVTENLRPLKIAVSPLSYGQLSDKMFASSIIRGLFNVSLTAVPGQDTEENRNILDKFNKVLSEVRFLIEDLAPRRDGVVQIFPYLLDFFWVDLGQAVYVLKRSSKVSEAFKPLKHITYSTRDFWTEVAIADRGGMTRDRWTPVA